MPHGRIDYEAESGPIHNPVDRFAHLPELTRKVLDDLREDDIDEIKEAVRFMRSATTVGRLRKGRLSA